VIWRGEVWAVQALARRSSGALPMLVVAGNAVIRASDPAPILAVPIVEENTIPDNLALLAVRLTEPVIGVARAIGATPVRRARFRERLGRIDDGELERVDIALRAVLDL
jgi:mRNA-degrading endonuclease toxin of MazEF toxin-antitoxin module